MKKDITTLKVNVKEGNFVSATGEVNTFTKEKIVGNGWLVRKKDGIIEALCFQDYPDGTHSIRATIDKNNRLLVTLRTPKDGGGTKTVTKKDIILAVKGELTGILYLYSGRVDDRYVYFRDDGFNEFLKNHKVQCKFKNPNMQYVLKNKENCQSNLFTDGNVDEIEKKEEYTIVAVKNATWVIFYQALKINQRIESVYKLFTKEDYKNLKLPKMLFKSSAEEYVKNLKKYFTSLNKAKFYLLQFDFLELTEYEDINLKSDQNTYYIKYELICNILHIKVYKSFYWYTQESMQKSGISPEFVKFEINKNRFMTTSVVLEGNVGICYV